MISFFFHGVSLTIPFIQIVQTLLIRSILLLQNVSLGTISMRNIYASYALSVPFCQLLKYYRIFNRNLYDEIYLYICLCVFL